MIMLAFRPDHTSGTPPKRITARTARKRTRQRKPPKRPALSEAAYGLAVKIDQLFAINPGYTDGLHNLIDRWIVLARAREHAAGRGWE